VGGGGTEVEAGLRSRDSFQAGSTTWTIGIDGVIPATTTTGRRVRDTALWRITNWLGGPTQQGAPTGVEIVPNVGIRLRLNRAWVRGRGRQFRITGPSVYSGNTVFTFIVSGTI